MSGHFNDLVENTDPAHELSRSWASTQKICLIHITVCKRYRNTVSPFLIVSKSSVKICFHQKPGSWFLWSVGTNSPIRPGGFQAPCFYGVWRGPCFHGALVWTNSPFFWLLIVHFFKFVSTRQILVVWTFWDHQEIAEVSKIITSRVGADISIVSAAGTNWPLQT